MSPTRRGAPSRPRATVALRLTGGAIAVGSMLALVAGVGAASAIPAADQTPHKSYICKYVSKPGEAERLQSGQNPIWTDNHSLLGYDGTVTVGQEFKDGQFRSVVIVANTPKLDPEPSISACVATPPPSSPPPSSPPPSTTTTKAPPPPPPSTTTTNTPPPSSPPPSSPPPSSPPPSSPPPSSPPPSTTTTRRHPRRPRRPRRRTSAAVDHDDAGATAAPVDHDDEHSAAVDHDDGGPAAVHGDDVSAAAGQRRCHDGSGPHWYDTRKDRQLGQIAVIAAAFTGLLSLFNIAGRFLWASLSDYIGRKPTPH